MSEPVQWRSVAKTLTKIPKRNKRGDREYRVKFVVGMLEVSLNESV